MAVEKAFGNYECFYLLLFKSHYFLTLYFSILSDIVGYILMSDLNKQGMFQTIDHLGGRIFRFYHQLACRVKLRSLLIFLLKILPCSLSWEGNFVLMIISAPLIAQR